MAAQGQIDAIGFSPTHAGWLMTGWLLLAPELASGLPVAQLTAELSGDPAAPGNPATIAFQHRPDMPDKAVGLVCLVKAGPDAAPTGVTLRFNRTAFRLARLPAAQRAEPELIRHCRTLLQDSVSGQEGTLSTILRADAFTGADTLDTLPDFVRAGVDELVVLRPGGAVLIGWLLAWPGTVASVALCSAAGSHALRPIHTVATERHDVLEAGAREQGFADPRCGFIALVDGLVAERGPAWLRIETAGGEIGYTPVPARRLRGMPAIRRLLDAAELQPDTLRPAFDAVLGPACRSLNAERMARPAAATRMAFGAPPAAPRGTLVIPLFGRVDYLEHQLATLAALPGGPPGWDILYVLDDPPRRQAALALAESAASRFGVPFTLLMLDENRGFAAACNAGLAAARGGFVCFLNSDVLPMAADFADRLADRLHSDPALGLVGGLLLFPDGSVQHEGMRLQPVSSQGGLCYPVHLRKGLRPRPGAGLEPCELVTGACMVLRRDLATRLGGFDEGFITGDFEDADLCLRVRAEGLELAVDHQVRLVHLERQSQAAPDARWRSNMTAFNAWHFDARRAGTAA